MKLRIYVMVLMLLCTGINFNATAKEAAKATVEQNSARALEINDRVKEIRAMDFTKLNKTERRELKTELKEMHKELKHMGPTVIYISTGALILIIILLIILL